MGDADTLPVNRAQPFFDAHGQQRVALGALARRQEIPFVLVPRLEQLRAHHGDLLESEALPVAKMHFQHLWFDPVVLRIKPHAHADALHRFAGAL